MRVVSVNVGLPRTVRWKGRDVTTGIFKEPVQGRVPHPPPEPRRRPASRPHRPRRSREGGLRVPARALRLLAGAARRGAALGAFGENLTVEGLPLEDGGRSRRPLPHRHRRARRDAASAALLQARPSVRPRGHGQAVPRQPTYRLLPRRRGGGRGRGGRPRRDDRPRSCTDPGGGDHARVRERPGRLATIERLVALEALPDDWRSYFRKKLAQNGGRQS